MKNTSKSHLLFIFTLYVLSLIYRVSAADNYTYPYDSILLDCGTETEITDETMWETDFGSKYAASELNTSAPYNASHRGRTPNVQEIPYMTARVFKSEFTYSFPVNSAGWKRVVLNFYSSSYGDLSASDAMFSVSSGGYTLLRDFSLSQTSEVLKSDIIDKVFYIYIDETTVVNITFTPSSNYNNSYALVNGIEIWSVLDNMFNSTNGSASVVGEKGISLNINPTNALEMVVQLNVGGDDSRYERDSTWSDDSSYIVEKQTSATYYANSSVEIKHLSSVNSYESEESIYRTARTLGSLPDYNQNQNLTWVFSVDPGFYYLVRLHFCEIDPDITKVNQRVFQIFLNGQTVEDRADVVSWTGNTGNGIALYKDYAVRLPEGEGQQDLWVALHPKYYNVILNGLEIFKVNDTTGNLAAPNPIHTPVQQRILPNVPSKSKIYPKIIIGVVSMVAASCLLCVAFFVVFRMKRQGDSNASVRPPLWIMRSVYGNSHLPVSAKTNTDRGYASSLSSDTCQHFSFAEIKAATSNFSEGLVLGNGGFGKVYKGEIENGTIKVAIKRGNPLSKQGVHEFQTEIELLSKLRHRHLVSLIGYCEENSEMILVYDYMALGTLRQHLYHTKNPPLSWKQRLEICIGAARGLHYLHTGAKQTIIHRDVKTTNILLDEKWVAKVSDFGLSKIGPSDDTHVSTAVKGSFGYLDPEYFRRQQITEKSDVYSFGVVLFEVLCAKPALNPTLADEEVCLAEWALENQREGILDQIIDPYLNGKIAPECLKTFGEIAEKCLSDKGVDRPAMGDVLWSLEYALELQENMEGGGGVRGDMDNEETPFTKDEKKDPDEISLGFNGSGNNSWSSVVLPH
ncbi:receptor-like protein kinase FERONIA [Papaver somniferum]|uniref:receptor-like protein kinase FERONIA n=1 Tax=Papaver somniferum TaxID=3469 RepID=UPI000E703C54|nr:receptor-like protein kinase FERONIA [Papaver somniferum]